MHVYAGNRLDDKTCTRVTEELITHKVAIHAGFDKSTFDMVEQLCPALKGCFPANETEQLNFRTLGLPG